MAERTVDRNGVADQGESSRRPQNAYDGKVFYDVTLREALVWDATVGNWFSVSGRCLYSASAPRMLADDFKTSTIDARYSLAKGSNGSAAYPANTAGKYNGEVVLTTGAAGDTVANDGTSLTGPALDYKPSDAAITLVARVKLGNVTNAAVFIGLTDTLAASGLEMPFTLATTTYTSNATDAVGFLYDSAATAKTWRCVGVKNDVDATAVNTAVAPVAGTYVTLKITVSTAGVAKFYIDGTLVGTVTAACTPATALTPIIVATARTTTSLVVTADYLSVK